MNFLAHLYLAGDDEEIIVGQMLGDFLEPRWQEKYSPRVCAGVELHRFVDRYTDAHPLVSRARRTVRPPYRRFAGVLLDMFFDHFLARGWDRWSPQVGLEEFALSRYAVLERHEPRLTARLRRILPSMVRHDWLGAYAGRAGIERALRGMSRRLTRENPLGSGAVLLDEIGLELQSTFDRFFPELITANEAELARVQRDRGGRDGRSPSALPLN